MFMKNYIYEKNISISVGDCRILMSQHNKWLRIILAALVSVIGIYQSEAKTETFYNEIKGASIITNATFTVVDPLFGNWSTVDVTKSVKNQVVVEFDEEDGLSRNADYTYSVTLEITALDIASVSTTFTRTFTVSYLQALGSKSPFRQIFYLEGYHSVEVKVTSPPVDNSRLRIYSRMTIERVLVFDSANNNAVWISENDTHYAIAEWDAIAGADEYELEYVFYNELSDVYITKDSRIYGINLYAVLFTNNATRINTDKTFIFLPKVFPKGILVFRYRAIHYDETGLRVEGDWCTYNNASAYLTDEEYEPDYKVIETAFEEDKAWQYEKVIVENDQTGGNIAYFDGTLRKRQTSGLYKTNSSFEHYKGIYQDYAYDLFGRPVFTTLPYLSEKGLSEKYDYKYLGFLKNTLKDDNDALIDGSLIDNGKCGIKSIEMTNDEDYTSAGRYYSPNCTDCLVEGFDKIPNAEGYPYTLQQFTPDNTGRIQATSAPGFQLRLGGDHDTRYFYGKPAQQELDRLFGTEVGYDSKYTKNLVVDPNGQISVTYLRGDGKTIATALAGAAPNNLIGLDSYENTEETTISQPIKTYSEEGNKRIFTYTLLLSQPSDISVHIGTTPAEYTSLCKEEACYDCLYDITVTLSDACGNTSISKTITNYLIGTEPSISCINGLPDEIDDVLYLSQAESSVGEWYIRKEINVSQSALDYYTESFLTDNSCLPNKTELITNIVAETNFSCISDCESCQNGLGSQVDFVEDYLEELTELGITTTGEDEENAIAAYEALRKECEVLCYEPTTCESLLDQMKGDLYPGGQYATYSYDETGEIVVTDESSIFYVDPSHPENPAPYTEIDFKDQDNVAIILEDGLSPSDLTIREFISRFDESWTHSLVALHPEFCIYEKCKELETKIDFEYTIQDINTWAEAVSAGYLLNTNPPQANLLNNDPFFSTLPGSAFKSKMESRLNDVSDGNNPGGPVNLELLITSAIFCPDKNIDCDFPVSPCTEDKDFWWQIYKKLYFGFKQQYICELMEDEIAECDIELPEGKESRWMCNYSYPDTTFIRDPEDLETFFNTSISASCEVTCESYVQAWRAQLQDCGIDGPTMDELMDRFVAVCKSGCDPLHPFGSSTCNTATEYGDYSFSDAFYHLVTYNNPSQPSCPECPNLPGFTNLPEYEGTFCVILLPGFETGGDETHVYIDDCIQCEDPECNVLSITIPTANGTIAGVEKSVISLIGEECICEQLAKLKTCFEEVEGDPEIPNSGNFLTWLNALSDWDLTSDELVELTSRCLNNCVTLSKTLVVPPTLQCNVCKTAEEVFGAFWAYAADCGELVTEDNYTSFEIYMNHELSLNLEAEDYLNFINLYNTYYDDIDQCSDAFVLCPSKIADLPTEDCFAQLYTFASNEADRIIEAETERLRRTFQLEYIAHCLPKSNISVEYDVKEYHYTLYYYDQAGNLVMTVPPEGVHPLTDNFLDDVAESRDNGLNDVRPEHTKQTKYWYNSLNQVVKEVSPDAGWVKYWYDRLGRIIISQKANQVNGDRYAYSVYDGQGRIIESGEGESATPPDQDDFTEDIDAFDTWRTSMTDFADVFKTFYDEPKFVAVGATFGPDGQENLRKRIASTVYYPVYHPGVTPDENYQHASHYNYDVSGNVKTLVQDIDIRNEHMLKKMEYDYEQASGKVKQVAYQRGEVDEFYHAYTYDDNSKLIKVQTSRDGMIWENDADYTYYEYGPLKRKELGTYKVQGSDYFNTIQGWTKGINASILDPATDIGSDGSNTAHPAADATAFTLSYFRDDYESIDGGKNWISDNITMLSLIHSLYNGNIRAATYAFKNVASAAPRAYAYEYDQLNRLLSSNAWEGYNSGTLTWTGVAPIAAHANTFTYSADGNILTQIRDGVSANLDNLTYHYMASPLSTLYPSQNSNRLGYVDDASGDQGQGDLPDQSVDNYTYDESGNLITDASENLGVSWKHFNKINEIVKTSGPDDHYISYGYDAFMNRLYKRTFDEDHESDETMYYVRDASGNVMAIYRSESSLEESDVPVSQDMKLDEIHIYGSGRLGILYPDLNTYTYSNTPEELSKGNSRQFLPNEQITDILGNRHYELTNHLGNVLVTISDRHLPVWSGSAVTSYDPDIISSSDYYPFGAQMPGRKYNADEYRYGFNGKENDNEIKGDGNQQDYGMRIYDPRLGKFLSVDPLAKDYSGWSPYPYAMNSPIEGIDLDGLEYLSNEVAIYEIKNGLVYIKPQYMDVIQPGWNDKVQNFMIGNQLMIGHNNIRGALSSFSPPVSKEYLNFDPGLNDDVSLDPIRDEQKSNRPTSSNRNKKDGTPDRRYTSYDNIVNSTPPPLPIKTGSVLVGVLILADLYESGKNSIYGYQYFQKEKAQDVIIDKVYSDVQSAINKGGIIPTKYQNTKDLSVIMNILFQGVNNSYPKNKELEDIALKIRPTISVPRVAESTSTTPWPWKPIGEKKP